MKSKICETISKVIDYIENIKEWKWLLITFFLCLVVITSISIPILWQPYIHAEDGVQFLKDALFEGKSSLFKTFGGYLGVLPRLFSLLAIYLGRKYNSMILVIDVMKLCSTVFTVIVVNYFNSKEFKHLINSRILRLLICTLLMFVMSNHIRMVYTSITTHWWGGLLGFLVGLNFMNKKMPPMYIIPFLILALLSAPSALIVAIPIIYYLFTKIKSLKGKNIKEVLLKNKAKIIILVLIAIAGFMEVYAMLFMGTVVKDANGFSLSIKDIFVVIYRSIKATIESIPYILTHRRILNQKGRIIVGILIFSVLFWRYIKNKNLKLFSWSLLAMFILYFMAYYKKFENTVFPSEWFYCAIQATIGIFLIVKLIYDDFYNINKILNVSVIIVFIVMNCFFYKYIDRPDYSFCDNIFKVEPNVNFSSDKIAEIVISPGDEWVTYVPVN